MTTNTKLLVVAMLCLAQFISCKKESSNDITQVNAVSEDEAVTDTSLTNGLVAWYPFNGDVLDHSGNNNNVIYSTAVRTKGKSGKPRTAYMFNGMDSYMEVNNSSTLNPKGRITLYALIKPTGFYHGECHSNRILTKGFNDWVNGRYALGYDDQPYYGYNGCDAPVQIKFQNPYGTYGNGLDATGITDLSNYIKINQWFSIAYTYDGTFSRLFINGTLAAKKKQKTTFNANTSSLFIGRNEDPSFPYYFKGVIDEIRIYRRALTADEILRLYSTN